MGLYEGQKGKVGNESTKGGGKTAPMPADQGQDEVGIEEAAHLQEHHGRQADHHDAKAAHHDALASAHSRMADHHRGEAEYHRGKA